MLQSHRRPTGPGQILQEEFMRPLGLTQVALAAELKISLQRLNGILKGRRAVTAETAVILSDRFGTTAEFWLHLQNAVDLWTVRDRAGLAVRR